MILYNKSGAMLLATTIQTLLAASKVKLFKENLAIAATTTKAMLVAAAADFSGYADKTVATWQAPYLDSAGGATISSGYIQWDYASPAPPALDVPNTIYGFWIEDAAGDVLAIGTLDEPVVMAENGDSLPLVVNLNYGRAA